MRLINLQRHGMLCQKLRAAQNSFEKLQAAEEYMQFMDEVENDMMTTHYKLEVHHLGKTAD